MFTRSEIHTMLDLIEDAEFRNEGKFGVKDAKLARHLQTAKNTLWEMLED